MNFLFFIILFILFLSLKCDNIFEFYKNKKDTKMKIKRELDKKYPHTAKLVKDIGNVSKELYDYYSNIKFDKKCIKKKLNKYKKDIYIKDFLNLLNDCKSF